MSEADSLRLLNKRECPDCQSERMSPGLRIDIAEHLKCHACKARFYRCPAPSPCQSFHPAISSIFGNRSPLRIN